MTKYKVILQLYVDDEKRDVKIDHNTEEFSITIENTENGLLTFENDIHTKTCGVLRWVYNYPQEIIPMQLLSIQKMKS